MSRQARNSLRFQPARGAVRDDLPVGKKQLLEIERLAHDGRGIAFVQGRSWFVSGAMPGERVLARVLAVRNKVVDAQVMSVEQAGAERQQPFCPLAGQCGGCTLQHMPIGMQRAFKQDSVLDSLQRAGVQVGEVFPMLQGPEHAYRRRARIAVRRNRQGEVQLGFRALASQQIVEVGHCPVLVEPLQAVFPGLVALVKGLEQADAIGHLELFHGNQVALLVRLNRPLKETDQQRMRNYCAKQGMQLWWQEQDAVRADVPEQPLFYELEPSGLQIDYQPGDFVQVNAVVNQAMVQQALDWLAPEPDDHLLDLYCGLGNFSLPLARLVRCVTAVEGVQSMVGRARQSARRQGVRNIDFQCCDLSGPQLHESWAQQQYSAVLLDPPRDGAAQVVEQLAKMFAEKILYVSCNPATLARDAALLQGKGYKLARLAALDMFSHTGHVEAMALFVRSK